MGATTDSVRVWRDLLVLHARVIEELASALEAAHGLSVSEFDVLINLDPTTAIRHGDLADRVILSRTALQVRRAPPTTDSPPAAILTEAGGIPHPSSTTHEGDLS